MHGDFQRNFAPERQQVARPFRRALESMVGVVQACRALQRNTLLTLRGVSKTVGVHATGKLAITRGQQIQIQAETRLQIE